MAILAVQSMSANGGVMTRITPNAGGDSFALSGNERLYFLNSGAAKTVTLVAQHASDPPGAVYSDLVVSLADGATTPILHEVKNLAIQRFKDTSGRINLTYSAVTGLILCITSN